MKLKKSLSLLLAAAMTMAVATGCSSGSVWNSASRRQKRVSLSDISSSL